MSDFELRIVDATDVVSVEALVTARRSTDRGVARDVAAIVRAVRRDGDRAVVRLARRFDALHGPVEMTRDEMRDGAARTPSDVRTAIRTAARHIARIARRQRPRAWTVSTAPGVTIEQRVVPLESVGCYVPGGRHPLLSSLLMTAIPAHVAGVPAVVACCPNPAPAVLTAAIEANVARMFRIGGAHAIAALAYGTETIPRVEKIVGPGNAYVAAAKEQVSADCPIDFRAGPSEIVVISTTGNPAWIAADLIAQAEHDPDARALLLTSSRRLAMRTARQVAAQLPATGPARESLQRHGGVIVTRHLHDAIRLANRIAPEHVACDTDEIARAVTHCGTVFVGRYAAQAAGDYATGSNHVLPTAGAARYRGGLGAADFVRVSNVQRLTRDGIRRLGPTVMRLAEAEGLSAHAASIAMRLR